MKDENIPLPAGPAGGGRRLLTMFMLSAAIAVCGMIIGATGVILWLKNKGSSRHHHRVVAETVERIKAELKLSDQQVGAVERVVQDRYDALSRIREEMLPRVKAEFEGIRDGVGPVLTPEQNKRWSEEFTSILKVSRLFQRPNATPAAEPPSSR